MYLFVKVHLSRKHLLTFGHVLRKDRHLSSLMKSLTIGGDQPMAISSLFIVQRLHLECLYIEGLDLAREHTSLPRLLLSHSVEHLHLNLQERQVSRIIRFINSFPCLNELSLGFMSRSLEDAGQMLPNPSRISSPSLLSIDIGLVPGVSMLLDWFLKDGSYLARMEVVKFTCIGFSDKSEFCSCFGGVRELLQHCSATIVQLNLQFMDVPMVNEISDICKSMIHYRLSRRCINDSLLVHLEALPNLRDLIYWTADASAVIIIKYINRQLSAVSSEVGIKTIDILGTFQEPELVGGLCGSIDSILTGGNFPSLSRCWVPPNILDYFPNLHKAGIV